MVSLLYTSPAQLCGGWSAAVVRAIAQAALRARLGYRVVMLFLSLQEGPRVLHWRLYSREH